MTSHHHLLSVCLRFNPSVDPSSPASPSSWSTMTLSKEDSIAADSTLSVSPIPVKRAPRTYASSRPKDTHLESSPSAGSSASRQNIYRTASKYNDEVVASTSDAQQSNDEAETPSGFNWDWQQKMWEIDHPDEPGDAQNPGLHVCGNAPPKAEGVHVDASSSPQRQTDISHADVERQTNAFGVSLASLTASSSQLSPPTNPSRFRNRKKVSAVIHDSDSGEGETRSSPTSPEFPNPISTPKLHSSPTPPTSDVDVDVDMKPPSKTRSKGKGKACDVFGDMPDSMATASIKGRRVTTKKIRSRDRKDSASKVRCTPELLLSPVVTVIIHPTGPHEKKSPRVCSRTLAGRCCFTSFYPTSRGTKVHYEKFFWFSFVSNITTPFFRLVLMHRAGHPGYHRRILFNHFRRPQRRKQHRSNRGSMKSRLPLRCPLMLHGRLFQKCRFLIFQHQVLIPIPMAAYLRSVRC